MMELRALTKEQPQRSSRSSSSSPLPSARTPRLCRPREPVVMRGKTAASTDWSAAAFSCCTPTPTPTATPSQTPLNTPTPTPPKGVHGDSGLPPVPPFSSRFSPSCATAKATASAGCGASGAKVEERIAQRVFDDRAEPFAGQGAPFCGGAGGRGRDTAARRGDVLVGFASGQPEQAREQGENTTRAEPSVESEVAGMFDESQGTLRLVHDGLGDERVPSLSLEKLKEIYRGGRGSVCSWRTTAGLVNRGDGPPAQAPLVEVEQGRLGVLSSNDAYLFHFKEMKLSSSSLLSGSGERLASVDEVEAEENVELHLVYVWIGREASVEACAAARAQGKRLLEQQPPSTSRTPLLEVEQGCEPALFLALFSYMLPPLAAVVLQGRDETPDLRVLELQETPCLPGSGIVMAVEGPCSASLLAKHGPLPDRSYICLVRPRRHKVGRVSERGGVAAKGGGGVGIFDAAYYWHGVGETPAVERVGILLCQQVDRMFPSPSTADCGKRRSGRRRRGPGGVGLGDGMMRGYVADVKLGLPVPEGFWACLLPEISTPASVFASEGRRLLSDDLRPECRSRPVRVFGVCAGSRKARQSFVWEVTAGGMPCQMRLSPSLSHVVDAGGSSVYVWHGNGSSDNGRRLACRVARAYAARVEGGVSVHQVDAGSEPVGLLDCFIGWNQALVEPPPMLSMSPGRRYSRLESGADVSPLTTPATTPPRCALWSTEGMRSALGGRHDQRCYGNRSSGGHGTSSESSGSRLTPPGQRTPTLGLSSPPSLKNLTGGVYPPSHRCVAATDGMPAGALSTPPRRHAATYNSTTGCGGRSGYGDCGFSSTPCLLGLTSCIDAFTADRTTSPTQLPGGAASFICGASSSSSSALDRPDDESSSSDSTRPRSDIAASRRAPPYADQGSRRIPRPKTERGEYPTNAGQQCAGGQGESGAGDDESRSENSADGGRGKDEHTSDDDGHSGRDGDEKKEGPGGWQNSGGGGGGGRDGDSGGSNDGDGATTSGDSGTQDDEGQEVCGDDDGEDEAEECGAGEDMDTFLRLSEVELCEGIDVLRYGRTSAKFSTSSEALDSSIGGRSSGGGVENSLFSSRHLSDFFQSPLALDLTPRSSRRNESYSIFDSTNYVGAFSSPACGTSEIATGTPIICDDNPPIIPGSKFAEDASNHHASPVVRSLPTDGPDDVLSAENDESLATVRHVEVNADPVLVKQGRPCAQVEIVESEKTEPIKEEKEQADICDAGLRDGSIDGGGGESEEEWLTRPDSDVVTPELESWGINSESTLPSLGRHETTKPNALPTSKEEGPECTKTAATVGQDWAGLNEDGSWRTEVARRAAGEAGAVEAERRRLAKISADESWRLDAGEVGQKGCCSTRDVRRESTSFTRLQTGNVRDKLNVFEGSSGSKAGKEKADNRTSIGALHGRGLVSAWTKRSNTYPTPPATTAQAALGPSPEGKSPKTTNVCTGDSPSHGRSAERQPRRPPGPTNDSEEDGEFLWKAGPAPCRLKGRPSLGLIRNGQVRIMTKALLMSCNEGVAGESEHTRSCDEADTKQSSKSSGESFEPPMPSKPPPPPPVETGAPPPLPVRPSKCGNSAERAPPTVRPSTSSGATEQSPAVPKSNFWLAKAGLTRKKLDGLFPASAPATPPRNGGAWMQGGGTRTPPPTYLTGRTGAGVVAEARILDAASFSRERRHAGAATTTGVWARLHRRLEEEGKHLNQDTRID